MKILILLLALVSPVFARIGETEEECHKRYGANTEFKAATDGTMTYFKGDIRIIVKFRGGKCTLIMYISPKNGLSDIEIEKLQASNCSGLWKKQPESNPLMKMHRSSDNQILSVYTSADKTLILVSETETLAATKEQKEAAAKKLDGL